MNDLYLTAKILENEAPYSKDSALVAQMASELYMTFDLILLGSPMRTVSQACHECDRAGLMPPEPKEVFD